MRSRRRPRFVGWLPEYNTSRREYGGRVPCVRVFNRPAPGRAHAGVVMGYRALSLGAALLLASCTTTSKMMIADDEAIISVQANTTLTSPEALEELTLRDAAKLTRGRGYRYFFIEQVEDTSRRVSVMMPATAYTTGTATAYGGYGSYSGTATYTPPYMISGMHAGERVTIKMANQKPSDPSYDAEAILGHK